LSQLYCEAFLSDGLPRPVNQDVEFQLTDYAQPPKKLDFSHIGCKLTSRQRDGTGSGFLTRDPTRPGR